MSVLLIFIQFLLTPSSLIAAPKSTIVRVQAGEMISEFVFDKHTLNYKNSSGDKTSRSISKEKFASVNKKLKTLNIQKKTSSTQACQRRWVEINNTRTCFEDRADTKSIPSQIARELLLVLVTSPSSQP